MSEKLKLHFLVMETFAFGDALYAGAFARWLASRPDVAEVQVICSARTAQIPWEKFFGISTVHAVDSPWTGPRWWRRSSTFGSLIRLAFSIFALRRIVRRPGGVIVLNPRGGLLQGLLGFFLTGRWPKSGLDSEKGCGLKALLTGGVHCSVMESRRRYARRLAVWYGWPVSELNVWTKSQDKSSRVLPVPYLVICPEASIPCKYWRQSYWKELIDVARAEGLSVVVVSFKGDSGLRDGDADLIWSGDISSLSALLSEAAYVVSVDSFAAHLAALNGVPVCVLFGNTEIAGKWTPESKGGVCPIVAESMEAISVKKVIDGIYKLNCA